MDEAPPQGVGKVVLRAVNCADAGSEPDGAGTGGLVGG
jgi:hypothetical protein